MNIVESKLTVSPVDWPTNMAWRVQLQRYKNLDPLCDLRRNKVFAMPFRNWCGTFWNLVGKDVKKIKYMKTQVLEIPDTAIVADMELIDNVFFSNGGSTKPMTADGQQHLAEYIKTAIPYSKFKDDPYVFSRPEILIEPNAVRTLPLKVSLTDAIDENEYPPIPLLGVINKP